MGETDKQILDLALYTFNGDKDKVNMFMYEPHLLLDNKRPIDMCQTKQGEKKVRHILNSIIHGLR